MPGEQPIAYAARWCSDVMVLFTGGDSSSPTIMVVDDDANIRAILKYRFQQEDFIVRLARIGMEALEVICAQ